MKRIPRDAEAVLVLIRHGAIVRPTTTSNFDRAPLSSEGWQQMTRLASEWPFAKPSAVYSSDLLRGVQSATILQTAFHVPLEKRDCLREWTADPSDLPQPVYMDLERRAWRDLDWVPPGGESLRRARDRALRCMNEIAAGHHGDTVAVVGHGTLFSQFTSALKTELPTEGYKNSIPFAGVAVVALGDAWRLAEDFHTV